MFVTYEVMPRFPGCEELMSRSERKECGDATMLEDIYSNLRYPDEARASRVEGTVVVSFVVEEDGLVTNVKLQRDVGCGLGAEAVRLVERWVTSDLRWVPATQAGKAVRVQYYLPVKFELGEG